MIKKILQKFLKLLGYKITKFNTVDTVDLDKMTMLLINKKEPTIFDVGANHGQSIERYKKLYQNSQIHSFEPNKKQYEIIESKFKDDESVYYNNVGVADKAGTLELNINATPGHSSFKNIVPDTTWLKKRSITAGVDIKDYTLKKFQSKMITLDTYCEENKIKQIDILKIDVQGFEDKVLDGAQNLLKASKIKLIQLELIFTEIYEKPLSIYDVEKFLIPNKYKLFGISNAGSLISNYIYQQNHIYISEDIYIQFKAIQKKKNNL